jgi:adenylate cyclase
MGKEIERKFLVRKDLWYAIQKPEGEEILQGYIVAEPGKVVRIRLRGNRGILTLKAPAGNFSRHEFEYSIPAEEARQLLTLLCDNKIEKVRYTLPSGNHHWEVDEFFGDNEGLVLAEIELNDENEPFEHPQWLGEEVTFDKRYYNAYLAKIPFTKW